VNSISRFVVIGGDFNVDFKRNSLGKQQLCDFMQSLDLVLCDDTVRGSGVMAPVFTYCCPNGIGGSFIDHFCLSRFLYSDIASSSVIDTGDNLSDHRPICISLDLRDCPLVEPQPDMPNTCLRWDKADLGVYYNCTYERLAALPLTNEMQYCVEGFSCSSAQSTVDWLCTNIVDALNASADMCVPRVKSGFFKWWWDDTLNEMKQASIDAHGLWKACGSPRSGDVFIRMKKVKLAYKTAIKAHRQNEDLYFSDELHDLLVEKDMINFWRTWNAKIVKPRPTYVVDGETNDVIAQKFADHFKCDAGVSVDRPQYSVSLSDDTGQLEFINVELVSRCLSQMKRHKAPGVDRIETEHLLYAHPIVIVQLCVLFNIMLKHCVVPRLFFATVLSCPYLKISMAMQVTLITIEQLHLVLAFPSCLRCVC
jgi:hypothetical protein